MGAAEAEVGRYVYRRIEALMGATAGTAGGRELSYLSAVAASVEEYGEEACAGTDLAAEHFGQEGAGEPVAGYCKACGTQRSATPCHKCGGELKAPHPDWEEPLIPEVAPIRALAREVGYAIGEHGSKERDLDLIAAPWTADAVSPQALADHIAKGINGHTLAPTNKPAGRWSCNIQVDGWFKLIDLSVSPPNPQARIEALEADAARYRYLRDRDPGPDGQPVPQGLFVGQVPNNLILTGEDADRAIDAALSQGADHGG